MIIAAAWIVLALVVAYVAGERGRSAGGFLVLSLLLSPIVGLLALIALPDRVSEIEREQRLAQSRPCPACAELVLKAARVCRYCGSALPPAPAAPPPGIGDRALRLVPLGIALIVAAALAAAWYTVEYGDGPAAALRSPPASDPPAQSVGPSVAPRATSAPPTPPVQPSAAKTSP